MFQHNSIHRVGSYIWFTPVHWPMAARVMQLLTFEERQWGEFHLGALVTELGWAVGPPLPGSAHRPPRETVHFLRGRHREAGGRRGRAGRRQFGRLHDGCGGGDAKGGGGACVRACLCAWRSAQRDVWVNGGEDGGVGGLLNYRWIFNWSERVHSPRCWTLGGGGRRWSEGREREGEEGAEVEERWGKRFFFWCPVPVLCCASRCLYLSEPDRKWQQQHQQHPWIFSFSRTDEISLVYHPRGGVAWTARLPDDAQTGASPITHTRLSTAVWRHTHQVMGLNLDIYFYNWSRGSFCK